MTTATAEKQKATFTSRSRNLRIILKARRRRPLLDISGAVVSQQPVPVEETPAQVAVLGNEEVDHDALPHDVQFKNWKFETDDENVIAALRRHPSFGKKVAGFKEVFEKVEVRLADVTRLSARGDVDGLRAVIELEKSQGNRASVLEPAQAALAELEDQSALLADIETEAEAEGSSETAEAESTPPAEDDGGPPDDD